MTEQTREHSLDELARGLASGAISRSKALRLVGGMLGGAVLASVPGVALAQQDCNPRACCESRYEDLATRAVTTTCRTQDTRTCVRQAPRQALPAMRGNVCGRNTSGISAPSFYIELSTFYVCL
jgi:hypothetical protein